MTQEIKLIENLILEKKKGLNSTTKCFMALKDKRADKARKLISNYMALESNMVKSLTKELVTLKKEV